MSIVHTLLHEYCLLSSALSGFALWFVYVYYLRPKVLVPLCYSLGGVKEITDSREKNVYHDKFPMAITKTIGASIEFYMWVSCFALDFPGWRDWTQWHVYGYSQSTDNPEYLVVHYPYFTYFVQIWFIFFYDMLKRRPNATFAQYTFDAHHLITIVLLWGSIGEGHWRWGFLTRFMSHLPMDLSLYCAKIIEYVYKSRTKRKSDCFLAMLMIFVALAWVILKVVIYGYVVYAETLMFYEDNHRSSTFIGTLLIAAYLLWVLQVIWLIPITQMTIKYVKCEKETYDIGHADGDAAPKSKSKTS